MNNKFVIITGANSGIGKSAPSSELKKNLKNKELKSMHY